jgi:Rrf2 family protein
VTADAIAGPGGTPTNFLRKSLLQLVTTGALRAARGPHGGYRLARPAKAISLLDVIEAVNGPLRGEVDRWAPPAARDLDDRLQQACDRAAEAARKCLRGVTIADLAGR